MTLLRVLALLWLVVALSVVEARYTAKTRECGLGSGLLYCQRIAVR